MDKELLATRLSICIEYDGLQGFIEGCHKYSIDIKDAINLREPDIGCSMLGRAIASCKIDAIEFFLEQNAEVNVLLDCGYNELHIVAESCIRCDSDLQNTYYIDLCHRLIDRGVSLKQRDREIGNIPVFLLIYAHAFSFPGGDELIKRCVRLYPNPDVKSRSGATLYSWLGGSCPRLLPEVKEIIAKARENGEQP